MALPLLVLLLVIGLITPVVAGAQDPEVVDPNAFPGLTTGQRIYDETGTSLTPDQVADLQARLERLGTLSTPADAMVYVRALDATTEETDDQVDALQSAWISVTGATADDTVVILINRNPGDPNDARMGIAVGATFDDGNLPAGERSEIITDEMVPSLREGDVYGALTAALTRMESSIVNGPPRNGWERFSDRSADSWLPWAAIGAAVSGAAGSLALFGRRNRSHAAKPQPTTTRPGSLTPALAASIFAGSPPVSVMSATLLDLAARDHLAIEPESAGGTFSKPKIQVRLLDGSGITDLAEQAVWTELEKLAEGDRLVPSKQLEKLGSKAGATQKVLKGQMAANGWSDSQAASAQGGLFGISAVALVLAIFGFVVVATAEPSPWVFAAPAALAVIAVVAFVFGVMTSPLSVAGQEERARWQAYRDGVRDAAKDEHRVVDLDIDAILPDAVGMGFVGDLEKRLKAMGESGQPIRAFQHATGTGSPDYATTGYFPFWLAYSSSTTSSTSAGSSSTVSSGTSSGGGSTSGST
ncbi:MAG TPA: TPM domain-containing protein [Thermomicrobiales bacterium]|nr:TPM domain-containing protein [Thermomicrobiales bacterium]